MNLLGYSVAKSCVLACINNGQCVHRLKYNLDSSHVSCVVARTPPS